MSKVYVMIGLPGAGKSTMTRIIPGKTVSSDEIRDWYEFDQKDNAKTFSIFYDKAKEILAQGYDVILDATSIKRADRKRVFKNLPNQYYIAVYIDTPIEKCKERNAARDRVVPNEVIDRMFQKLTEPTIEEGFDEIWRITS